MLFSMAMPVPSSPHLHALALQPIALIECLPDHLIIEILARLVKAVGLRASVAAARSVSRLFRSCCNVALEQSLQSLSSRNFDAAGLCSLVRCVLYGRFNEPYPAATSPRFLSLTSVVLTGSKGVDASAVGILLAHAPDVKTLQLEGTSVLPEETAALAHMMRKPIAALHIGCWTALHEAVSSPRRFTQAVQAGALTIGGSLQGIYIDVCNERGCVLRKPRHVRACALLPLRRSHCLSCCCSICAHASSSFATPQPHTHALFYAQADPAARRCIQRSD